MLARVLISRRKSWAAKRPSPSCSGSVLEVAATETPARPEPKAAGRSAWCCPDRPARTRRYIKRCNWPTDRYSRRSRTHRPAGSAHRTSRMPLDMSARPGRFQAAGSRQRPAGASCLPRTHRPGTAPHRATRRACRTISCGLHAARRPAGKVLARHDGGRLGGFNRVRSIRREAHLGERRRRPQLGDQPHRRHGRMPVHQVVHRTASFGGRPVHGGTVATCCNQGHARLWSARSR